MVARAFPYVTASALRRWPVVLSTILTFSLVTGKADALDAIGTTVEVDGQVSGTFGGGTARLARGDGVVSNEVVRTEIASSGEIRFVDQTKLFVGPTSTVTLDSFVFDPSGSGSASQVAVNISKGALRFISGRSAHNAYRVNTPLGSLGMRGTIADVVLEPGRVIITDQRGPNQGEVVVTARNGMSVTLEPGQSVILTSFGISTAGPSEPDFATACSGCTTLFGFGGSLGVQPLDPGSPGGADHGHGDNGSGQSGQSSGNSGSSSSDIRLKRDIVEVGQLANGLHLYHFRYNWADQEYVGVMAQEVEKVMPGAVSREADGYLRVDYGQLGLRLETWDEWLREHPKQASRVN